MLQELSEIQPTWKLFQPVPERVLFELGCSRGRTRSLQSPAPCEALELDNNGWRNKIGRKQE